MTNKNANIEFVVLRARSLKSFPYESPAYG